MQFLLSLPVLSFEIVTPLFISIKFVSTWLPSKDNNMLLRYPRLLTTVILHNTVLETRPLGAAIELGGRKFTIDEPLEPSELNSIFPRR